MLSTKRYYLAADGETVVEAGDERAATLLVGEGCEIPDEQAKRYGIHPDQLAAKAEGGGEEEGPAGTPLPADFPSAALLVGAGYGTVEKVRALTGEELVALPGIGNATAEKIGAALAALAAAAA